MQNAATNDLRNLLAAAGYEASPELVAALRGGQEIARRCGRAPAFLLLGPPGAGKTALAEAWASALDAELIFAPLHAWSGNEDLIAGVNVPAAVAGRATDVDQPGHLTRAAVASQTRTAVLVLDELDKAPEAVEGLLLDFLQNFRVVPKPGTTIRANAQNLWVFATSNEARPHTDALLRRFRRVWMNPLPLARRVELAAARSGVPGGIVERLARLAELACAAELRTEGISVQELTLLAVEASTAGTVEDLHAALIGWAARTNAGREALTNDEAAPKVRAALNAIHGALRQWQRAHTNGGAHGA